MAKEKEILNIQPIKIYCLSKASNLVDVLSKRLDCLGESWVKFLPNIFIIKFALTMIALLTITTLFMSHIHLFTPITSQFTEWVSSSIIAFTLSIIIVKFVVISICLTIFTVKRTTIENVVLRLRDLGELRLSAIIWKKVHFKFIK